MWPGLAGGDMAKILSQCKTLPMETRAVPIIEAFLLDVGRPPETLGRTSVSDLAPRAAVLLVRLLGIRNLGPSAIPFLKAELAGAQSDEEEEWLALALGIAGDGSRAEEIKRVLDSDDDVSMRTVALYAYAGAKGYEAVPLLERLANDRAEAEHRRFPDRPSYPVADSARSELARLKRQGGGDKEEDVAP